MKSSVYDAELSVCISLVYTMPNFALLLLVPLVAAVAIPEVNSVGVPLNVPANETQLYPPYTYVSPSNYVPRAQ